MGHENHSEPPTMRSDMRHRQAPLQAAYKHHSSSASSLSGFSRTPSSESLFFQFDDLFANQSARNVELEHMNISEDALAVVGRRRRKPSLARRLSRLFAPPPQQQEDKSLILPGIHKSQSQPQFRPQRGGGLEGYSPRPLNSCSTASQRSSCSSEELSDASRNSSSDSNSFADVFGRFDDPSSRVPLLHPPPLAEDGPIFIKSDPQRASRTLPRSLQKQISRKKILDSLFEEPDRPARFKMAPDEPPSDPDPEEPVSSVITPVHRRVRKPGMVMSLSRAKLVRNLLTAESLRGCDRNDGGDRMLKNGGCDYDNNALAGGGCDVREDNVGDLCNDVIGDDDMKDIFDSADGDGDQVVPEVKETEGCEREEEEDDDIERARRKIENKVLVIFDGDQLPTNKGVMSFMSGFFEGREGREIENSLAKLQAQRLFALSLCSKWGMNFDRSTRALRGLLMRAQQNPI